MIHALDVNPEAVKTVDMNKHILNLQDKLFAHHLDIVELAGAKDEEVSLILEQLK